MDLQYADTEVGPLLGAWSVICGVFLVSTTRPTYHAYIHTGIDRLLFVGLLAVVIVGCIGPPRLQDRALGAPIAVCGLLLSWTAVRTITVDLEVVTAGTLLVASGLCLIGCLCIREGMVTAQGRRREGNPSRQPLSTPRAGSPTATDHASVGSTAAAKTRWRWWLAAAVLIGSGFVIPV